MKKEFNFIKVFLLAVMGVGLAIISLVVLSYFQYYIHELGHTNVAVLSTFTQKNPTLTLNFTYVDFPLIKYLKVPQQTGATILTSYKLLFNLAGVFANTIFYAIIFLLVAKIKIIKDKKFLEIPLVISFLILIFQDIAFNLFCGTDGFNLSCSDSVKSVLFMLLTGILLISLGFFFVMLTIKNKMYKKIDNTLKQAPRRSRDFFSNTIAGIIAGGFVGTILTIIQKINNVEYKFPSILQVLIIIIGFYLLYLVGLRTLSSLTKNKEEFYSYKSNIYAGFMASIYVAVLYIFPLWFRLSLVLPFTIIFIFIIYIRAKRRARIK